MTSGFDEHAQEDAVRERYRLPPRGKQEALEGPASPEGRFALEGPPIAGLSLLERRRAWPEGSYVDVLQMDEDPRARVSVLVSQAGSRAQAIDRLVEFLSLTMAARLPDASESGLDVGEFAFAAAEDELDTVAFVRGPIFFRVSKEGSSPVPIDAVARHVDAQAIEFLTST
jgi:hypothetical protein